MTLKSYPTICALTGFARRSFTGSGLAKDIVERSIAAAALVIMTPLFLVVALAIKLESPGPVFFRQPRGGKDGNPFRIFKFRSMRQGAGLAQAQRNDVRVTRVGAFLRKTSIDELPQLLNVLIGDMAIVGPRPHSVAHDEFYASQVPSYMSRYSVKPGMTGWAQINDARGETETPDKMARRCKLDRVYIQNQSLLLDLFIIGMTPLALLKSRQAY